MTTYTIMHEDYHVTTVVEHDEATDTYKAHYVIDGQVQTFPDDVAEQLGRDELQTIEWLRVTGWGAAVIFPANVSEWFVADTNLGKRAFQVVRTDDGDYRLEVWTGVAFKVVGLFPDDGAELTQRVDEYGKHMGDA